MRFHRRIATHNYSLIVKITMNSFLRILLITILLSCNSVTAQKIVTDTILFSAGYDEYCETIKVCERVMLDSVYHKYDGSIPDEDLGGRIKYRSECYNLGYNSKTGELYGYKDFVLSIGDFTVEFSYPQYSFFMQLSRVKGNSVYLTNTKSDERIEVEWISFYNANMGKQKFMIKENNEEMINFLSNLNGSKFLEFEISPIKYPINEGACGNVIHKFPTVKIEID